MSYVVASISVETGIPPQALVESEWWLQHIVAVLKDREKAREHARKQARAKQRRK